MVLRGALGGMGGFAVQLAKDAGIMAVAIEKNFAYAKELRAALTVDYYSNERLGQAVEAAAPAGVGLVFNRVSSGETPTHGLSVLEPGGALVSTLNNGQHLGFAGINSQYVLTESNALQQDELRRLVDAGKPQV